LQVFFPLCLLEDHGKLYSAVGDGDCRSMFAYMASIGKPSVCPLPVSPFGVFRICRGDILLREWPQPPTGPQGYIHIQHGHKLFFSRTSLSKAGTASTGHISSTSESRDLPRTDWIPCPLCKASINNFHTLLYCVQGII
jgi:hypothetical protein